jgi:hypothetical protein
VIEDWEGHRCHSENGTFVVVGGARLGGGRLDIALPVLAGERRAATGKPG